MPEMFTRAMKVGMLYLCYKQIFPFLATAVNGLRAKRHRAQRGEVRDQREEEQRRGTAARTKRRGNTWQPFDHVV